MIVPNDYIFLDLTSSYPNSYSYTNVTGVYISYNITQVATTVNYTYNRLIQTNTNMVINTYTLKVPPSIAPVDPYTISIQSYGYTKMSGTFSINV